MAGTYGEPGKNPFTVPGVSGILSPVVDSTTGVTQIYRQDSSLNPLIGNPVFTSVGTYNPSTGKFTPDTSANLSDSEIKSLSSSTGTTAISGAANTTATKGIAATGTDPAVAQTQANKLTSPNSGSDAGKEAEQALQEDLNSQATQALSRSSFSKDLRYPSDLKIDKQDIIKFNMLKLKTIKLKSILL